MQDYKKTLKVTWLPADLKTGGNIPVKCLSYDHKSRRVTVSI